MASDNVGSEHDYSCLKDLRFQINGQDAAATLFLCFWLYLPNTTPFPSTILRQMHSEIARCVPFLVLDEEKKMMLFPLLFLHKEAPSPHNSTAWVEIPHASAKIAFSFAKWVHVGCEVASDLVRLHINGEIAGEMPLSSSAVNDSNLNGLRSISLAGTDGDDDRFEGYIHSFEVLPKTSSIKAHFVKNPPLQLSVDGSSASEIEEDEDGVWSIVGGKVWWDRWACQDKLWQQKVGGSYWNLLAPQNRQFAMLRNSCGWESWTSCSYCPMNGIFTNKGCKPSISLVAGCEVWQLCSGCSCGCFGVGDTKWWNSMGDGYIVERG